MARKWTEQSATEYLNKNNSIEIGNKVIKHEGFKGLTSCSAFAFLTSHCGYISCNKEGK